MNQPSPTIQETTAAGAPAVRVERIDPVQDPRWDDHVADLPGATVFHSAGWARVLSQQYGYEPVYFVQRDAQGRLSAVLPMMEVNSWLTGRRGISLPFTDDCEPLAAEPAHASLLVQKMAEYATVRNWRYWELRGGRSALCGQPAMSFYGHSLALTADPTRLFARCDSAVRWAVRKAEDAGVTIQIAHDAAAVRTFYDLMCKTRRRHGLPPQPLAFFETLRTELLARGGGCVVLARFGSRIVAGAIFLHFGQATMLKYAASDADFHHLKPNNLVMWRAIEWHARAGYTTLDFGRTSLENKGLRHFKLGWGTVERRIEYTRYDRRADRFVTSTDNSLGRHTRLFKILPSALSRVLGAAAYRHIA